jgi:hypothetical protein
VVSVDRLSIYQFRPLGDSPTLLDQAVALTRNALSDRSLPKPAVVVARHLGPDGDGPSASIHVAADGSVELAGPPATEGGGLTPIAVSAETVYDTYKTALAFQAQG